jgi:hypothetical protein
VTTGVLLLHGSSGKPDLGRVKILEAEGFDVVAPQWFDDRISEISLESFPLDELAGRVDERWTPDDDPPSYVGHYQQSLRTFPEEAEAAQIPAERFGGDLLLMAGGDDQLWPSFGHTWCGS